MKDVDYSNQYRTAIKHKSGRKYSSVGIVLHQEEDWKDSEKSQSATIFFEYYSKAKNNATYLELKEINKKRSKS